MPMKPGLKMVLMEQVQRRPESNRSEYGGGNRRMIGYDRDREGNAETRNYGRYEDTGNRNYAENRMEETESRRRRDSRGRYAEGESWEGNGRYTNYPWSEDEEMRRGGYDDRRMGAESRRRRDSRGRYMMEGMDDDEESEMRSQHWYPPYGNTPQMMYPGNSYGDIYAKGSIYAPGAMNRPMHGSMDEEMMQPIDEHTARKWVRKMDGGEHYKPEQLEQLRNSLCPDCDMWSFYVAINAMYSDYCETARKMGVDKAEFYGGLAKDFLKDKDAKPHKLRRYMEYIAK